MVEACGMKNLSYKMYRNILDKYAIFYDTI